MSSNTTNTTETNKDQKLSSKVGTLGNFWIVNKQATAHLGADEIVILMEHISSWDRYKKNDGFFYRTKEDLLKILPCGLTSIQQKENKLIELGLLVREQRGQDRRNWYTINEENVLSFTADTKKYIKARNPNLCSSDAIRKRRIIPNPQSLKNNASSVEKQCLNKKEEKETVLLLRKRNIVPKDTLVAPLRFAPRLSTGKPVLTTSNDSFGSMKPLNNKSIAAENVVIPKKRLLTSSIAPESLVNKTIPVMTRSGMNQGLKAKAVPPISNRKVPNIVIEVIKYWNMLPGVRVHNLKIEDNICLLDKQTLAVKDITLHVKKLLRGELYVSSTDIVHEVVKTMKFSVNDIKKAMERASKSTSLEYGGSLKKLSLDDFFYNKFAKVYPENPKVMYKWKYPFLFFINGDLVPLKPLIKGDRIDKKTHTIAYNGMVSLVIRKFVSEGIRIADADRAEIGKAVDVAMNVLMKNRGRWKQSETAMMTEFPYVFYACHRDHSDNPNKINDLWFVASYKFEKHLIDKRYI